MSPSNSKRHERYLELLASYGADPSRWPEAARPLAGSPQGEEAISRPLGPTGVGPEQAEPAAAPASRAAFRDAARLDAQLTLWEAIEPSASLRARVAEIPIRYPRGARSGAWWPFSRRWRPVLGLAGAAALGVAVGSLMVPDEVAASWSVLQAPPGLAALASEQPLADPAWDELSRLAFASDLDSESWPQ